MASRLPRLSLLILLVFTALPPAEIQAQAGTWALTNARIETVTRGVIERGTVLVRDGLIVAVGSEVSIPPSAVVLDLEGKTVSPGLIDLTSTLGIPSRPAPQSGQGGGQGASDGAMQAARVFADELEAGGETLRRSRAAGVTAVLVASDRGLFRGQSALVAMRDTLDARAIIKSPVGEHVGYQSGGFGSYPGSLLGVITFQRQAFYDATRYGLAMDRWRANPSGMARPEYDPQLEALVPFARAEMPTFVAATKENEIRRAVRLGKEHNLRLTLLGAEEAWRAIDVLPGNGVVVAVDFPRPNQVTGWGFGGSIPSLPVDSTGREEAARKMIERNPAALHDAGISFALASGGTRAADFVTNLKKAIAAGLPREVALAGATIRAAELAGVNAAMGSVETGKIANLIVSSAPFLADSATISDVFVDGVRYALPPPPPRRATTNGGAARGRGPGAAPTIAQFGGTWTLVTNSPQGDSEATLTVTQEGGTFTGSMVSQLGSAAIESGQIEGAKASWTITLDFGGQSFSLAYAGDVDGTRISGTVTAGEFGSFTFTGEKRP
jgi:imidazolonepropionase-like amidohydrolase